MKKIDLTERNDRTAALASRYGVRTIPHLVLYDGEGRKVSEGFAPAYDAFQRQAP